MENHRRGDSSISILNSIRHQFNGSATEIVLLTRLSMLQMHENELETAVNMEREAADTPPLNPAPGDDLSRMEAYDDLETLPSVTSRSRARMLMADNSECEDDSNFHSLEDEVDATAFYRPYVKISGIQNPRVIQSTPSAPAAWPTSEEELSFDTTSGSASHDHQSVGITSRNDDFEDDVDVSMSSSRANPSQTSKSIFSMSWFAGNASQSNSSQSTDSRANASMSLGGLSGF